MNENACQFCMEDELCICVVPFRFAAHSDDRPKSLDGLDGYLCDLLEGRWSYVEAKHEKRVLRDLLDPLLRESDLEVTLKALRMHIKSRLIVGERFPESSWSQTRRQARLAAGSDDIGFVLRDGFYRCLRSAQRSAYKRSFEGRKRQEEAKKINALRRTLAGKRRRNAPIFGSETLRVHRYEFNENSDPLQASALANRLVFGIALRTIGASLSVPRSLNEIEEEIERYSKDELDQTADIKELLFAAMREKRVSLADIVDNVVNHSHVASIYGSFRYVPGETAKNRSIDWERLIEYACIAALIRFDVDRWRTSSERGRRGGEKRKDAQRDAWGELDREEMSVAAQARAVGVSRSTIYRWFKEENSVA